MRTRQTDGRLIKTAKRLGAPSVYALAQALDRPYRRVLYRVKTLAAAGQLLLVPGIRNGRTVLEVRQPDRAATALPTPFPVSWSRPDGQLPEATQLAAVLMRPTFAGLLDASLRFGLQRLEDSARSLSAGGAWNPATRADAERALHNLRLGHARAARPH